MPSNFVGADTDKFVPAEPAPGFEVVSLRTWEPNYNIDLILKAFSAFVAQRPQVQARLHLLGGGLLKTRCWRRLSS